jgi:anti-sigma B factor antagonist
MSPILQIATVPEDDAVRVVADGELDLSTARRLDEALRAAEAAAAPAIVLDIDAVSFVDSTGLRVLLAAASRSRRTGNRLRLTGGAAQARRLFALTGVAHQLPTADD